MNEKQLEIVEHVESQLRDIARREAELEREREAVIANSGEYADYIKQYQAQYDDGEWLHIRAYYEKLARLDEIGALFRAPGADHEALWREYRHEIEHLERVLAA